MKRKEATGNMPVQSDSPGQKLPVQSDSPSQTQPIQRAALHHRAGDAWRYATPDGSVTLRLRAAAGNLSKVEVFYGKRYDPAPEPACKSVSMIRRLCDGIHDWFEVRIAPEDPRLFYFFRLTGQGPAPEVCHLQESGLYDEPTLSNRNLFFFFPYILPGDIHDLPEWARGASIYQIFPDRFARAEGFGGTRAPDGGRLKRWGTRPRSGHDFYGGNLEGIRQRIPHLVSLGIEVLYLTPLFLSQSAHRYDTDDYFLIDPLLGTREDLRRLTAELHRHGIRVVLDAVFNHCGPGFFAFADVLEKGVASRYADWFFLDEFPVDMQKKNYATFASAANMPKLNAAHPDVRDYLCQVGRYWIRETDIDGWRIDVANEVDPTFWRHFRDAVRHEKADAVIIGEIWGDATFWLGGDMFDGVMHYPFTFAVKSHFTGKQNLSGGAGQTAASGGQDIAGTDPGAAHRRHMGDLVSLDHQLNRMAAMYPHPVRDTGWTLLESHDTERFRTAVGEDESAVRLAAFLQFAYPGAPMVYYGAEAGMTGGDDPDCRQCMPWEETAPPHPAFSWYRQLLAARKALPALRTGAFQTAVVRDGLYAFWRMLPSQTVLAVMNESSEPQTLSLEGEALMGFPGQPADFLGQAEVLSWAEGRLVLRMPGRTGALLANCATESTTVPASAQATN